MTGEILYVALLSLYPKPFRTRFGGEMIQLFRDCYPHEKPLRYWSDACRDFAVSVPREWRHEFLRRRGAIDSTLVLDALMVASVVVPLLLGWGWIATVILFSECAIQHSAITNRQFADILLQDRYR